MRCVVCLKSSVDNPDQYEKVYGKWILFKWINWWCPKCQYSMVVYSSMNRSIIQYQKYWKILISNTGSTYT